MCVEHTCNFSMGNEFKVTLGYTARLYFKRKKGRSHVERKADFFLHATEIIEVIQQQCSDSCSRKGVTL